MSRFGVVMFPGSNCDQDAFYTLKDTFKEQVDYIWHQETKLSQYDGIIIPGGFSYGDYLRCGAVARFSPVMKAVDAFAKDGGLVIGICNGFQILCEAGLLPGALVRNEGLHFVCKPVNIRVENTKTPFTSQCSEKQVLTIPIAHGEGCYVCEKETLAKLNDNGQVLFRYCGADGEITPEANPNGSLENIAGVANEKFNVLGMMPHPERACDPLLNYEDGIYIMKSFVNGGVKV